MQAPRAAITRGRAAMRVALGHYITSGIVVAFGLLLISGGVHLWLGAIAASTAAVGVLVSTPPDFPAPRRGKFLQMLPAPLIGLPLFFCVQLLHAEPLRLGLLLVPATFLAFLAMAWGKRGIPIAISVMFSMIFSIATPTPTGMEEALERTLHFGLGAGLYVVYATLANLALNARYRVQVMADLLLSLAALMRTEAGQFRPRDVSGDVRAIPAPTLGRLLREQAALADLLQAARDIVLESPRTPRRQKLAGMLVTTLELRDLLLASELDLDALLAHPAHADALRRMQDILEALAADTAALADAMLLGRQPQCIVDRRGELAAIQLDDEAPDPKTLSGPTPAMLARGMANRIGHINDEVLHLYALALGESAPDLAVVRANWKMFVSPTRWSIRPFFALWRWDAPPLRHAIRASLAIAAGYAIAAALTLGSHEYWILLTIVVVLRGSLSQTLERRNHRVAGTLLGCVLVVAILSAHPQAFALLAMMTVAQAVAHGFAIRRYMITAVAATVVGLIQAHMLNTGVSTSFALFERVTDTLIGASLAWAFCYVLPSWERNQIPALVARTLKAQSRHARLALGLGQLREIESSPELEWRLARREAFDSLSALVQATQRSLSEPRAVRPPLAPLEHLQAHSYQLLAQLSAIKSMLVLRRDRLTLSEIEGPLARTAQRIEDIIASAPVGGPSMPEGAPATTLAGRIQLPDPFDNDITPWLLRRLDLATGIAAQLRDDASRILQPLAENAPEAA
ncbi:MAG TPA: FUSC family membrane protein [Variovorax sp.]